METRTVIDEVAEAFPVAGHRRWVILTVLCMSVFVAVMDGTIVNVALPSLVRELGATSSQLQWVVDAYTLVFAGLLLVSGSLSDRFGRKGFLIAGMVVFGSFSAVASLVGSANHLIAARAAMGVGAALIFPATLAILVNVFRDPRQRAKAIAIWAATSGLAVALGPVTGGFLLEHFYWGSVFLVNVPLVILAVVLIALFVPTSRDRTINRFDFAGTMLSISGITILVWAVIEGPSHGWTSRATLTAFAVALTLLLAFVLVERHSRHPMLDVRLFSNPRFSAGTSSINVAFFGLMGFTFLVSQYFQFVRGYSTLSAGLHTIPFALFMGVAAPMSPKLVRRIGTKRVVVKGLVMMAIGLAISGSSGVHTPYAVMVVSMFFMGSGLGIVNAPATDAIMGSLSPDEAGVGSAVNDTSRELGGTFGVAVLGSVFSSVYTSHLTTSLQPLGLPSEALDTAKESVGAGVGVAQQVGERAGASAGQAVKVAVDNAFINGFRLASVVAVGVVLGGALLAARFLPAVAEPTPAPEPDDARVLTASHSM